MLSSSGVAVCLTVLFVAGCGGEGGPERSVRGTPTFSRDIAPILFEDCASCHRPDGIAPFSVLSYDDVRPIAERIAAVTEDRSMPPWLPAPGGPALRNDPSLSPGEIELIAQWVQAGAPEGDPDDLPDPPRTGGWQLGEPDLVVEMPEPYLLPSVSRDVFRNFVVPIPNSSARYVRAVEFRPESERVSPDGSAAGRAPMPVHHAVLRVDTTPSSRRMDALDPEPGYEGGMSSVTRAEAPRGFFMGWTPGKRPHPLPEGMAWRLDPGTDLVIEMHLQPMPRPQLVSARVGFHFTDRAPTRTPTKVMINSLAIDIPAGDSAYVVESSQEFPVDVEVLALYPHAHFLGEEMDIFAVLPDGSRRELLRIDDWNFNFQDLFRYVDPIALPRGSVLHMRYVYDNSSANPQNPHDPPRRVGFGLQSTDEMAELHLQVLPRDSADRMVLERTFQDKFGRTALEGARFAIDRDPDDPDAHYRLAVVHHLRGAREEAIASYRRAIELRDDHAPAHADLGTALVEEGRLDEGIGHLRRATEVNPDYGYAHYSLGNALELTGDFAGAVASYRRAVERLPEDARPHFSLGNLLKGRGRAAQAERHFREALKIDPGFVPAHYNLANLLAASGGRQAEALEHYRAAIEGRSDFGAAHINLGLALESLGRVDEAIEHYRAATSDSAMAVRARSYLASALQARGRLEEAARAYRRALELEPDQPEVHFALGDMLYTMGRAAAAVKHLRAAVRLNDGNPEVALALAWLLATHPDPDIRAPEEAVRLAEGAVAGMERHHPIALSTLAAAHAATGEFQEALTNAREAMGLARGSGEEALQRNIQRQIELYREGRALVVRPGG